MTIRLGSPLPGTSSGLPEGSNRLPSDARRRCTFVLGLLRVGFTESDVSAAIRALLPHAFTLTPRAAAEATTRDAVYFLWHFPWGYPRRLLAGTLPYGARTFLHRHPREDTLAAT